MRVYYSRPISPRGFRTETRRRAAVAVAREFAARHGFRGRIQFAYYPRHCNTRGQVPIQIRVWAD